MCDLAHCKHYKIRPHTLKTAFKPSIHVTDEVPTGELHVLHLSGSIRKSSGKKKKKRCCRATCRKQNLKQGWHSDVQEEKQPPTPELR